MSDRLSEHFSREAIEYLAQLEQLLAEPGVPDAEHLLRLARGVRGSAQMASADTIAGVAERLEDAARALSARHIIWSEELRRLAVDTVRDLQVLVRALHRWGPEEEARIRSAIERWGDLPPSGPSADRGPVPIRALFHDDAGPHVVSGPGAGDDGSAAPIVSIASLLLRGDDALQAAVELRPELERVLRERGADGPPVGDLLGELFDLVDLARSPEADGG